MAYSSQIDTAKAIPRDSRFDFYRGVALWMLFVGHVEIVCNIELFSPYMLRGTQFCDAADVFLFISGYLYGHAYLSRITKRGLWFAQVRSIKRALQVYLGNSLTLAAVALMVTWTPTWMQLPLDGSRQQKTPVSFFLLGVTLFELPFGFDILVLYIALLLSMPTVLWLLSRFPQTAIVLSFLLYLFGFWTSFHLVGLYPARLWRVFNPASWQFLFVLAMFTSVYREKLFPFIASRILAIVAAMVVFGSFVAKCLPWLSDLSTTGFSLGSNLDLMPALSSKSTLGPLRIINVMSLAMLCFQFGPNSDNLRVSKLALPWICLGRHPLPLFCFSLFLTWLSPIICGNDTNVVLLYYATAFILMIWLSELLTLSVRPLKTG